MKLIKGRIVFFSILLFLLSTYFFIAIAEGAPLLTAQKLKAEVNESLRFVKANAPGADEIAIFAIFDDEDEELVRVKGETAELDVTFFRARKVTFYALAYYGDTPSERSNTVEIEITSQGVLTLPELHPEVESIALGDSLSVTVSPLPQEAEVTHWRITLFYVNGDSREEVASEWFESDYDEDVIFDEGCFEIPGTYALQAEAYVRGWEIPEDADETFVTVTGESRQPAPAITLRDDTVLREEQYLTFSVDDSLSEVQMRFQHAENGNTFDTLDAEYESAEDIWGVWLYEGIAGEWDISYRAKAQGGIWTLWSEPVRISVTEAPHLDPPPTLTLDKLTFTTDECISGAFTSAEESEWIDVDLYKFTGGEIEEDWVDYIGFENNSGSFQFPAGIVRPGDYFLRATAYAEGYASTLSEKYPFTVTKGEKEFYFQETYLERTGEMVSGVSMYLGDELEVTIPSKTDGDEAVQVISGYAFSSSPIQKITVPDSVLYIENFSFNDCDALTEIHVGGKTEISGYAFDDNQTVRIFAPQGSLAQLMAETFGFSFTPEGDALTDAPTVVIAPDTVYENESNQFIIQPNCSGKVVPIIFHENETFWQPDWRMPNEQQENGSLLSFWLNKNQENEREISFRFLTLRDDGTLSALSEPVTIPWGEREQLATPSVVISPENPTTDNDITLTVNPVEYAESYDVSLTHHRENYDYSAWIYEMNENDLSHVFPAGSLKPGHYTVRVFARADLYRTSEAFIMDFNIEEGERLFYFEKRQLPYDSPKSGSEVWGLSQYLGSSEAEVSIPSTTYEGEPVNAIWAYSFRDAKSSSVTIPDSVWYVENSSFMNCQNLSSLQVGGNTCFLPNSFYDCPNLTLQAPIGSLTHLVAITAGISFTPKGDILTDAPTVVTAPDTLYEYEVSKFIVQSAFSGHIVPIVIRETDAFWQPDWTASNEPQENGSLLSFWLNKSQENEREMSFRFLTVRDDGTLSSLSEPVTIPWGEREQLATPSVIISPENPTTDNDITLTVNPVEHAEFYDVVLIHHRDNNFDDYLWNEVMNEEALSHVFPAGSLKPGHYSVHVSARADLYRSSETFVKEFNIGEGEHLFFFEKRVLPYNSPKGGSEVWGLSQYLGLSEAEVTIPTTTYEGEPVNAVWTNAFMDAKITSVTIPDSVWYVESTSFLNCPNLSSVTVSGNTCLLSSAFYDCPNLTLQAPNGSLTQLVALTADIPFIAHGASMTNAPTVVTAPDIFYEYESNSFVVQPDCPGQVVPIVIRDIEASCWLDWNASNEPEGNGFRLSFGMSKNQEEENVITFRFLTMRDDGSLSAISDPVTIQWGEHEQLATPSVIISPENLTTDNDITLTVNPVEHAESYDVQLFHRSENNNEYVWNEVMNEGALSHVFPAGSLKTGLYTVRVFAQADSYRTSETYVEFNIDQGGRLFSFEKKVLREDSPRSGSEVWGISQYLGSSYVEVTIPTTTYEGEPVNAIWDNAFRYANISSVIIPDNVCYVEGTSFLSCPNLSSVSVSGNTFLSSNAFYDCPNVTLQAPIGSLTQLVALTEEIPFTPEGDALTDAPTVLTAPDTVYEYEGNPFIVQPECSGQVIPVIIRDYKTLWWPDWNADNEPQENGILLSIWIGKNQEEEREITFRFLTMREDGSLSALSDPVTIPWGEREQLDTPTVIISPENPTTENEITFTVNPVEHAKSYFVVLNRMIGEGEHELISFETLEGESLSWSFDPNSLSEGQYQFTAQAFGDGYRDSELLSMIFEISQTIEPVSEISFAEEHIDKYIGDEFQLEARVIAGGQQFVNKLVTFTSSDESIATVTEDGLVTIHWAGEVTITASAESGVSGSCTIQCNCKEHVPELDPSVEPTCTETGFTEGSHCSVCGKVLTAREVRPALGHEWGEAKYTWNADNSEVTAVRVCSHDEEHQESETVTATSKITKAATCETMGETTYTSAAFQNSAFMVQTKTQEDVPALGHEWSEANYTWKADNSEVTAVRVCAHDEEHQESETVTATSEITKPATCETMGETTYTSASFQNSAFMDQTKTLANIPALGHEWGEAKYTWKADNSEVTAARVCAHDEEHQESETVTATNEITKAATCETMGETTYTSAAFQNSAFMVQTKTLEDVAALGHEWGEANYTWKADNSEVTAVRICAHDEEHQESETVTSTNEITKAATCETMGETTYTSATFQNSAFMVQTKMQADIPALGHDWGESSYTWSIDSTSVTASRTCANDSRHVETETVKATRTLNKAPTETEVGETTYVAAFINSAFIEQAKTLADIPALSELFMLHLPKALTVIKDEAFMGAAQIETIIVPDGCTSIGSKAFANCPKLIYIKIPASVTNIAEDAFEGSECVRIDKEE